MDYITYEGLRLTKTGTIHCRIFDMDYITYEGLRRKT